MTMLAKVIKVARLTLGYSFIVGPPFLVFVVLVMLSSETSFRAALSFSIVIALLIIMTGIIIVASVDFGLRIINYERTENSDSNCLD